MDSDSDSDDVDQFPPRHASSDKEEVETSSNKRDEAITKIIQGIPQERCRKEVASSSSSQNDQAIPRRPWKDEASTSQNNANDSPEDEEPDEQEFSRRPGKEPMASEIDDESLTETGEQTISRRPGKEAMASTSEIDDGETLAVTDEQEFSRRPGKEPMAADEEELESMLKELGFTSVLINPFIESMKEQDDPEEPEIPKSPIMGLVSSSHQITTRPLSVTDEPENPCGSSSGSSLEFPSQINSSAVHDEQEIPRRPEEHMASTSGVKEEQEIPMRPKEHIASPSGVKEEQEIIPRRPGKEAATTSEVTKDQEIIPRRPGEEAVASTSEGTEEREIFPKRPEKDEKERRRLNTCCTVL